jgi:hypothetical protein
MVLDLIQVYRQTERLGKFNNDFPELRKSRMKKEEKLKTSIYLSVKTLTKRCNKIRKRLHVTFNPNARACVAPTFKS